MLITLNLLEGQKMSQGIRNNSVRFNEWAMDIKTKEINNTLGRFLKTGAVGLAAIGVGAVSSALDFNVVADVSRLVTGFSIFGMALQAYSILGEAKSYKQYERDRNLALLRGDRSSAPKIDAP